ncbi:Tryptophan--tRNA ligase, mitochondrial [Xanthoria parietina]
MHIAQGVSFPSPSRRGFLQLIAHPFERRLTCGWAIGTRRHASSPSSPSRVIFSGIQPTGIPHLGNYVGALQQWVKIQDGATSATDLLFSIVDLHAMTLPYDQARLRLQKRQTLAALLAVGLDPQRSTIFFQSAVPAHTELMWILSCTASVGYLSRMTQWKSKLAMSDNVALSDPDTKAKLKLGLFSYPVLQSADILLYRATHVPVGHDQVQHLEFARENAKNFNTAHGHFFPEPQTVMSPVKRIMSLKDPRVKMSKSHEDMKSRILLNDTPDSIRVKVKAALTDSIDGLSYDPIGRPGVSNLLALMSYLDTSHRSVVQITAECQGLSMRAFKDEVAKTLIKGLTDLRERYDYFMSAAQSQYLQEVVTAGNEKAASKADETMMLVRRMIGVD